MKHPNVKSLKPGTQVTLRWLIPGALLETVYTVNSATNNGTKKNPQWRYYIGGVGFVDHEGLDEVSR